MGYLAEHMDQSNNLAPLFEVQLELRDPDLVFTPPLERENPESFPHIVESLISDVMSMADLIPRVTSIYFPPLQLVVNQEHYNGFSPQMFFC